MTADDRLIEEIVSAVLSRMKATAAGTAAPPVGETAAANIGLRPKSKSSSANLQGDRDGVAIAETIITGELLAGRVNGSKRIVVRPKALLTPSARDYLRTAGIECIRESNGRGQKHQPAASRPNWLALVSCATAALEQALADLDGEWSRELAGTVDEAADRAVDALCRGEATGVAVFCATPERAACRANRNPAVRAAVVADGLSLRSAAESMKLNLACIAPEGRSYFELRNLLKAFAAATPRGSNV
ncbi:MAG: hypothetical protein KY476_02740 [Planctomycetes bacterium]|nr:hypothetical protein [Planctomycetota bacterium]